MWILWRFFCISPYSLSHVWFLVDWCLLLVDYVLWLFYLYLVRLFVGYLIFDLKCCSCWYFIAFSCAMLLIWSCGISHSCLLSGVVVSVLVCCAMLLICSCGISHSCLLFGVTHVLCFDLCLLCGLLVFDSCIGSVLFFGSLVIDGSCIWISCAHVCVWLRIEDNAFLLGGSDVTVMVLHPLPLFRDTFREMP